MWVRRRLRHRLSVRQRLEAEAVAGAQAEREGPRGGLIRGFLIKLIEALLQVFTVLE